MNLTLEYVAEIALAVAIAFAVWVLAMGMIDLAASTLV
jgi:hypothetical protein